MARIFGYPVFRATDENGAPLVGGKLYSYEAGTSTPQATYSSQDEAGVNDNPVILNGNGEADVWLGSNSYKLVLKDANDVTLWTRDNVKNVVATSELADGSVGTIKITDGAITEEKLGDDSVSGDKVQPGALESSHLGISSRWAPIGTFYPMHTFNGAIPIPRGFMKMNGDQVTPTNYEAIHGAGAWINDGMNTSPLLNKYLPNMANRYVVGATATPQSGSTAISAVGNTGHKVNLEHNHTYSIPGHNHIWWRSGGTGADTTWTKLDGEQAIGSASNATQATITSNHLRVFTGSAQPSGVTTARVPSAMYTSSTVGGDSPTSDELNAEQSIQPESIEAIYIMKVI